MLSVYGGRKYLRNLFMAGCLGKNTNICWGKDWAMAINFSFWRQVSSAEIEFINMFTVFLLMKFIFFNLVLPCCMFQWCSKWSFLTIFC